MRFFFGEGQSSYFFSTLKTVYKELENSSSNNNNNNKTNQNNKNNKQTNKISKTGLLYTVLLKVLSKSSIQVPSKFMEH